MSSKSEAVKEWRKRTKKRIVEAMGGSCVCCGYNKCDSSLALHHLDPSKKDINLGSIRASARKWTVIVEELRKCVLVCSNCHGEIHAGVTNVPDGALMFDESFSDYKELERQEKTDQCPVCLGDKQTYQITCSPECRAKYRRKIDWDSVDIFTEIKTKSIIKLADELGCSDGAIHKRIRNIMINTEIKNDLDASIPKLKKILPQLSNAWDVVYLLNKATDSLIARPICLNSQNLDTLDITIRTNSIGTDWYLDEFLRLMWVASDGPVKTHYPGEDVSFKDQDIQVKKDRLLIENMIETIRDKQRVAGSSPAPGAK